MKNLLGIITALLLATGSSAQILNNGGFEDWNLRVIEDLVPYETSVYWSVGLVDSSNVVKDTNAVSGDYSIRMHTVAANGDTAFGYHLNGDPDNQKGGQAYTDRPDSLIGYYKYDIQPGDSALILILFRHDTVTNGMLQVQITGTQNSFTRFSYPISWTDTLAPDSMIYAAASSNAINEIGIAIGSELSLDGLRLLNSNGDTLGAILNGDFENWQNDTIDLPANWRSSLDDEFAYTVRPVKKSNDARSGNYAAMLETYIVDGDTSFGYLANFDWRSETGGSAFSRQIDTLYGYYKYAPQGSDSAAIFMRFFNSTDTTERGLLLGASANYSLFEIPFNLNFIPDVVQLSIASSNGGRMTAANGSSLLLDDLDFRVCDLPLTPQFLSGDTQVCEGAQMLQYVAGASQGASNFHWTLPGGTSFVGDSLSDTVYVNIATGIGTTTGTIAVAGEVYCGIGPDTSLLVKVDSLPSMPVISPGTNDSLVASTEASEYRWFHNGLELSAQTKTIKASKSGDYRVFAMNGDCMSDTSSIYQFVATGIAFNNGLAFKLYPNPAKDELFLVSNSNEPISFSLISINTSELYSEIQVEGNNTRIDLSNYPSGVYILQVKSSGSTEVIKLVIE